MMKNLKPLVAGLEKVLCLLTANWHIHVLHIFPIKTHFIRVKTKFFFVMKIHKKVISLSVENVAEEKIANINVKIRHSCQKLKKTL